MRRIPTIPEIQLAAFAFIEAGAKAWAEQTQVAVQFANHQAQMFGRESVQVQHAVALASMADQAASDILLRAGYRQDPRTGWGRPETRNDHA